MNEKKKMMIEQFGYAGLSKEEFNSIKDNIDEENYATLKQSSGLAAVLLGLLLTISFFVQSIQGNRMLYLVFTLAMLAVFITTILFCKKNKHFITLFFYIFLSVAYLFGIILGVNLQVNLTATTFCVLLFALPLLIIDKPYRISILLTFVTIVFCMNTKNIKVSKIASVDVVNAVSFLFLGVIVNFFVMKTKIQDIFNRRYVEKQRDTDDLTKLMTKAAALREIQAYFKYSNKTAALLVIDIDNFKGINDTMGHAYGDAVLHIMGKCIRNTFRQSDILARFGGDEFILFLPGLESIEAVRNRVEALVDEMNNRLSVKENALSVTGSIGIAFYPTDALNYEELFQRADEALYVSKGKGKNCYTFYFDKDLHNSSEPH